MTSSFPIVTPDAFRAAIPASQAALTARYEDDLALTRLVFANCAAVGDHASVPTALVVKGGFAVRHLYDGQRFSKDADVLPSDPDLDFFGPDQLIDPPGMTRTQVTVGDAVESWKVRFSYRPLTIKGPRFIQCDVNGAERPLQRRPPQRAVFSSRFIPAFPVWAATTEEIIAEKLVALMRRGRDRIRDAFDVCHVLGTPVSIDSRATTHLYRTVATQQGVKVTLAQIPTQLRAIAGDSRYETAWEEQLAGALPVDIPPFGPQMLTLAGLLESRVIKGS
jgi:predicted nucleotidyltransferase component of viral defense system